MIPRRFLYAVFFLFFSCASKPSPTADVWTDATLIAEQRAEIERLERDLNEMGEYQREVSERIDSLTTGLTNSLERCESIESIFAEIDCFVRELITENTKLRELQSANSGADAGTR